MGILIKFGIIALSLSLCSGVLLFVREILIKQSLKNKSTKLSWLGDNWFLIALLSIMMFYTLVPLFIHCLMPLLDHSIAMPQSFVMYSVIVPLIMLLMCRFHFKDIWALAVVMGAFNIMLFLGTIKFTVGMEWFKYYHSAAISVLSLIFTVVYLRRLHRRL